MRNNTTFAIAVLAAVALAQPALSMAADGAKPASLVPHSHTTHHVYGAPIASPIVGHSKTSHHRRSPKK